MNNKKDYIDLREGASEREAVGNGPPPVPAPPVPLAPAYAAPVRKGSTLITVVVVLSSLLVSATLIIAVMGFVFFNATSSEMHTQVTTEVLTENNTEDWTRQIEYNAVDFAIDMVEWGLQFGIDMQNWAREADLPYELRSWLEFLRDLENRSNP